MLDSFFAPQSVAVIGASREPGKLGYDLLANLVNSEFSGAVYPVNLKGGEILGQKVFQSVAELPTGIDLALIAVPAAAVLEVATQSAAKHIQNLVIISAGFKESGAEGKLREEKLQEIIVKNNLEVIGPNCLGILNPHQALNASFAESLPQPGNIALLSQSGAMAVAIMDWAQSNGVGFSKVVSLGNRAGITENELLEYLENDSDTEVILLYLESFAAGKKFMKIAPRLSRKKPIIALLAGASAAGKKAASSHTGSLAGSHTAAVTALKQCGVIHAHTIQEFFDLARTFSTQKIPAGNRVAIITNAGGPGVLATDAVAKSSLLALAEFASQTTEKLRSTLPATANILNPVDVIGDALADRYEKALAAILPDNQVDLALTILTPQVMTEKEKTAEIIQKFHAEYPEKPLLTSFIGGASIEAAVKTLAQQKIPNFLSPETAVANFEKLVWLKNWRAPASVPPEKMLTKEIPAELRSKIAAEEAQGNAQLSPELSTALLTHFGITVPPLQIASSEDEAERIATEIGYPVVLKIASDEILHKTDLGGVRLALKNAAEVKIAYQEIMTNVSAKAPKANIKGILVQKMHHFGREVIIGMKRDPVFGPLIMFGLGGVYVEVLKDVSFRLAPFSEAAAEQMIHEVKAIKLLTGVRGEAPTDIAALTQTLLKIADLALALPEIAELDLNPLRVLPANQGVIALDARFLFRTKSGE